MIKNSQDNFKVEQHKETHPTRLNRFYINRSAVLVNKYKPEFIRAAPCTNENLTLDRGDIYTHWRDEPSK